MPYSYVTYTGNGATTQFAVPFSYIRREHVFVNVNQVSTSYTWVNDSTVQVSPAPANGTNVEVRRSTPANTALVDFVDGSTPVAVDFDTSNLQHLYLEQELLDAKDQTVSVNPATGLPTLSGIRLTNVGAPVDPTDAATKGYVDSNVASAAADAAAAAASAALANDWATKTSSPVAGGEYSAKYHAQQASTSASAASTQAGNAATSASAAAASESAAGASAVAAAASAASAATLLDNFDDRYLGPKASDPTLDNDGNALVSGALYFNTTTSKMRVYSTIGGWIDATSAIVGVMKTFEYVATAGQTTFSGNDANAQSLTYTADTIIVSLNGATLRPGDDYTATNGTSIVLTSGAALNDELQVVAFGNFNVASHYTKAEADGLFQPLDSDLTAFAGKTAPAGAVVGTSDTQTLTAKTLTDPAIIGTILEDVYTISDGAAFEIDPGNGSIQLITLGANRTPKATNFAAGEAVTLMVDDGTAYTLTWSDATFGGSGVVWKTGGGNAPTLNTTGYTVIVLWKVSTQVYGARVGDA